MSGFYHFLPVDSGEPDFFDGERRLKKERLVPYGLADVLADVELEGEHVAHSVVAKGLDGRRGVLLIPRPVHGDYPAVVTMSLDKQTWRPVPAASGQANAPPLRYLGWLTAEPPTPEGLERRQTFPGYLVPDNHGQAWSIPIARSPRGSESLPRDVFFDAAGGFASRLKPAFDHLWEYAGLAWDYFNLPHDEQREEVKALDDAWLARAALAALGVNYRLGPQEITALYRLGRGVLDNTIIVRILLALIDWELVVNFQKKEKTAASAGELASSPLTPGGAAVSPIIAPPGENCS